MRRPILIAAILSLITTAVLADMYQDASNAKDPEARNNLAIGTVKSEGGDPPDAITRFYTWDRAAIQFQVNSQPDATEWGVEQAGQTGIGATRVCYSTSSLVVNCNFAALGATGKHKFGNGAGALAEIGATGTGPTKGYPQLLGTDTTEAQLNAIGSGWPDVDLRLTGKGTGHVRISNDGGDIAEFASSGGGATDSYIRLIAGNAASPNPRLQGYSDSVANVDLRVLGKGTGAVQIENDNGILGRFDSGGSPLTTAWVKMLGVDDSNARVLADSNSLTNANLQLAARGTGTVSAINADGNLATFVGNGATPGYFIFTVAPVGGGPATLATNTNAGVQVAKLMLTNLTVATLPACSATYKYALAAVSDQNGAPTYRGALTGGGALPVMAFCNGATWEAH